MQTGSDNSGDDLADRSLLSVGAPRTVSDAMLRKLLLVDDEANGAEFVAILLQQSGLQVVVVHSATEALQALRED